MNIKVELSQEDWDKLESLGVDRGITKEEMAGLVLHNALREESCFNCDKCSVCIIEKRIQEVCDVSCFSDYTGALEMRNAMAKKMYGL